MKKIQITLGLIVIITLSSCRKDRNCECTSSSSGATYNQTYAIGNSKKKDAQTICSSYQSTYKWDSCVLK
ncbi:MAG: hypothetical protein IT237_13880 [Bacteroidia bacterium]|nr:hypothetical protein [Bacteroidia bacterium]